MCTQCVPRAIEFHVILFSLFRCCCRCRCLRLPDAIATVSLPFRKLATGSKANAAAVIVVYLFRILPVTLYLCVYCLYDVPCARAGLCTRCVESVEVGKMVFTVVVVIVPSRYLKYVCSRNKIHKNK